MTLQEWATFQAVGGSDWLREKLDNAKLTPVQEMARDIMMKNVKQ